MKLLSMNFVIEKMIVIKLIFSLDSHATQEAALIEWLQIHTACC